MTKTIRYNRRVVRKLGTLAVLLALGLAVGPVSAARTPTLDDNCSDNVDPGVFFEYGPCSNSCSEQDQHCENFCDAASREVDEDLSSCGEFQENSYGECFCVVEP